MAELPNLDVLLVNPPFDRLQGHTRDHFPLGLAYLAGALNGAGVNVGVYNAESPRSQDEVRRLAQSELCGARDNYFRALEDTEHPIWREVAGVLSRFTPRILGLTVFTEKIDAARKISQLAKLQSPGITVIWGGPHPTVRASECLGFDEVDYVVGGEGEETIVELSSAIFSGRPFGPIPGVHRRGARGEVEFGGQRELQEALDDLPPPYWQSALSAADWPARAHGGRAELMTSRGCPYRCQYCSTVSMWGRRVRYSSVERVMHDIDTAIALVGSRHVFFHDDSFTLHRDRTAALCKTFSELRPRVTWECLTRADLVDAPIASMLKASGCQSVTFGVESGSPRILECIEKGVTVEQTDYAMAVCRQAGLRYNAFYMIGFPDETEDDIRLTIDHMRRSGAGYVSLNVFTPHPGSPLFDRIVEMGLLADTPDWGRYGRRSEENHFTPLIPCERFRELTTWAFRETYRLNRPMWRRIGRWVTRMAGKLPLRPPPSGSGSY